MLTPKMPSRLYATSSSRVVRRPAAHDILAATLAVRKSLSTSPRAFRRRNSVLMSVMRDISRQLSSLLPIAFQWRSKKINCRGAINSCMLQALLLLLQALLFQFPLLLQPQALQPQLLLLAVQLLLLLLVQLPLLLVQGVRLLVQRLGLRGQLLLFLFQLLALLLVQLVLLL